MKHYHLTWTVSLGSGNSEYQIVETDTEDADPDERKVVFALPFDSPTGEYEFPEEMRKKYQELTGKPEFGPDVIAPYLRREELKHVVYESPCRWAQRHRGCGLYCGHIGWLYAPRKCRRGIENGEGSPPQETCPGFEPNLRQPQE
ncbi:hypothetical protein [Hyphomicrobium sp. NDB2Meth4]|uniref:hypothetical protein n=1 Tax=Hyphomicrobium sp. NDB2Meth4 TaxID=1892846 RepID=UPI000931E805|nr:hypothetical protein [Hyphomicrobium sp. NDB2Meth4]